MTNSIHIHKPKQYRGESYLDTVLGEEFEGVNMEVPVAAPSATGKIIIIIQ